MNPGDSEQAFPPYAYVPGGPWPHPTREPTGHSHARTLPPAEPITDDAWEGSSAYRRGVALFNAGYYWEAHEEWERLWHAHGRRGPVADLLRALIKLAAAGVKVRERRPSGVVTHAQRASELLAAVTRACGRDVLGLDLHRLREDVRRLAEQPPDDPSQRADRVAVVLPIRLEPRRDSETSDDNQAATGMEPR